METLGERVRLVSDRLARARVDAGLDDVIAAVEREDVPSRAIATAGELLLERGAAVKAARDSVKRLRRWVEYTARILPFTEEGWPERRAELESRLAADPAAGLDTWIADAYRALGDGRRAAVERLGTIALPPGAEIVADRFLTAVTGIDERRWHLTAPIALPAAERRAGDRWLADETVRRRLRMLLLRLAIADDMHAEADRLEEACASDVHARPAVNALRGRRHRLAGDLDGARSMIAAATHHASTDLDVALERIALARIDDLEEMALDVARVAVAGLPVLSDVEATFARLVSDVPAELWVAVADRALAEGEARVHELAAEAAEAVADDGDFWEQAIVAEMQARSAEARGAPADVQAELLVWAGVYRMGATHVDVAIEHLRRAVRLDPDNSDAALRLADAKILVATALPLSEGRESLLAALDLIGDVQGRGPLPRALSWSFLTEAAAHGLLAREADSGSMDHRWRSLLAAGRSVAHEPDDSARWIEFADRTDQLGLFRAAEGATARAYMLDPESDRSISQRIQGLVNAGDFAGALELLDRDAGPWEDSVRGYILARAGRLFSAVDVLRTAGADPTWFWVSHTMMLALLLTDRLDEAFSEAEATREAWAERDDEIDGRLAAGWTALILGDFEAAADAAAKLKDVEPGGQAAILSGCALLLAERTEAGLAALSEALSRTRIVALHSEWQSLVCPALHVLAAQYRIELPPLDSLELIVSERRRALDRRVDPVEELLSAPGPATDSVPVRLAKDIGAALLQIAGGDLRSARTSLDAALRERPDDLELGLLARYVGARELAEASASPDELVTQFADVLERGPTDGAVAIVRRLLDFESREWVERVSSAVGERRELAEELDVALDRLAADTGYYHRVIAVRSELEGTPGVDRDVVDFTPDRYIRVLLPPSWFTGHPDPVNDHPLFNRHLPEIRGRATFTVPGVNVSTDETLEPDGYQILVHDAIAEVGRVDPGVMYFAPAGVELLGSEVQASAAHVADLGLASVPPDVVRESGGLAGLLAMTAVEVVARRIADVAHGGTRVLEEPAPQG